MILVIALRLVHLTKKQKCRTCEVVVGGPGIVGGLCLCVLETPRLVPGEVAGWAAALGLGQGVSTFGPRDGDSQRHS